MELVAGAMQVDITPADSQFLYGYPYVERYSTGIHDSLFSSALYLSDGKNQVMFITNDIIYVSKPVVSSARRRIAELTGIPDSSIMISATHTHSGPVAMDSILNEADSAVASVDPEYLKFLENGIVEAGVGACKAAGPAQVGFAVADSTGIGTNRRDPNGPSDHNMPVMMVKSADGGRNIACMIVCSMHPTVLHEDSKLVSADFPGLGRIYLQENMLGKDCPILHHSGPCGNQSPRHVTKANTFEEAQRIGDILGKAVAKALQKISFSSELNVCARQIFIDLPRKRFLSVADAEQKLAEATSHFEGLKKEAASPKLVRTAECDWFGAQRSLTLARALEEGRLEKVYESILPAEIQVIQVGWCKYVGWPCEIFVDYALKVKEELKDTFVVSLANGNLQGYIVTQEAYKEGGYEASTALISHEAGNILVEKTIKLIEL